MITTDEILKATMKIIEEKIAWKDDKKELAKESKEVE